MKFSPADQVNGNTINAYDSNAVVVNGQRHERSILVSPNRIITGWRPEGYSDLREEDLRQLLELTPDVVLLGTGPQQEFPPVSILSPFLENQIGIEIMDTASACRTYNILAAEGRQVAAALLLK